MQEKEKAQGFRHDFTPSELKALLFHSKKCPECEGELSKEKNCEMVKGEDVNSSSAPFFVSNIRVNHYGYVFQCQKCGKVFTLMELAEKN
ncbi:MAG: hypothetical protein LUE87_02280 [Lachnospiraceae bacterium]|nr:hypothetical protein [Lachnospiraceae bacterium]